MRMRVLAHVLVDAKLPSDFRLMGSSGKWTGESTVRLDERNALFLRIQ